MVKETLISARSRYILHGRYMKVFGIVILKVLKVQVNVQVKVLYVHDVRMLVPSYKCMRYGTR